MDVRTRICVNGQCGDATSGGTCELGGAGREGFFPGPATAGPK